MLTFLLLNFLPIAENIRTALLELTLDDVAVAAFAIEKYWAVTLQHLLLFVVQFSADCENANMEGWSCDDKLDVDVSQSEPYESLVNDVDVEWRIGNAFASTSATPLVSSQCKLCISSLATLRLWIR